MTLVQQFVEKVGRDVKAQAAVIDWVFLCRWIEFQDQAIEGGRVVGWTFAVFFFDKNQAQLLVEPFGLFNVLAAQD